MFFKEGVKFPYHLGAPNPDYNGEYPELFYTRLDDSSEHNGQWVLGWLVKSGQELTLEVIGASECYSEVQRLLKNEDGERCLVSDGRHVYHKFKPVKLVT